MLVALALKIITLLSNLRKELISFYLIFKLLFKLYAFFVLDLVVHHLSNVPWDTEERDFLDDWWHLVRQCFLIAAFRDTQ